MRLFFFLKNRNDARLKFNGTIKTLATKFATKLQDTLLREFWDMELEKSYE